MTQESNMESYKKPELIHIDDPAFDETGQGISGINDHPVFDTHPGHGNPPPGPDGNPNH